VEAMSKATPVAVMALGFNLEMFRSLEELGETATQEQFLPWIQGKLDKATKMVLAKLPVTVYNDPVKEDKIIEIEEEGKAKRTYWGYMKEDYFFGSYNRVINGKEQNIASFCKSEFA
jgi:hypothetical protein